MSSCDLSKDKNYPVSSISLNQATGRYTVQLMDVSSKCPDGVFTSRSLVVKKGASTDALAYSEQLGAPVVLLRDSTPITLVQDPAALPVNPSASESSGLGFFGWLAVLLLVAFIVFIVRMLFVKKETPAPAWSVEDEEDEKPSRPVSNPYSRPYATRTTQTVIHNDPGMDPMMSTLLAFEMGRQNGQDAAAVTTYREAQRATERSNDSDSEESSSSSSSSYSSDDSGSSYSSDSGSSYSSDDSGSFSSDSGGSFSSD